MKLLKWLAIAIAAFVVIVAAVGLSLPRRYQVVRDTLIEAPPDQIFPVIVRLRDWPTWTPWPLERYPDPDRKEMFTGPEEGGGATLRWVGKSTGNGCLEITKADPLTGIDYDFQFQAFHCTGGLKFFPGPDGTIVAWHTEGDLGFNPVNRFYGRFMNSKFGPDLETGLRNLKAKVEKANNKSILPQLQDSAPPSTPPAEPPESR